MRTAIVLSGILLMVLVVPGWARSDPAGLGTAEAASTTVTISWGPYNVPAASGGMPGSTNNLLAFGVQKPCTDCYVTGIVPNLVYQDGTTVTHENGGMLHHMVMINASGDDATCGSSGVGFLGERIFASGNERTEMAAPDGYGYYVAPTDSWTLIIDIMNMQPFTQSMYLKFQFTYRPVTDPVNAVTPVWLDVDNCQDSEYYIDPGYSDTHWDWTSTIEGYLVGVGGHVHNRGIAISAEDVQAGKYICTSVAGYAVGSSMAPEPVAPGDSGHPGAANVLDPGDPSYMGNIEDMTACLQTSPLRVGDTIRLHSQYNSPGPDGSVMGIMMAYVHETDLPDDADGDGWPDTASMPGYSSEAYLGTDPFNACTPNGWPPDPAPAPNGNGAVQIDDIAFAAGAFGGASVPRAEIANQNGLVQIDDVAAFASRFGQSC